jgi:exonuclease III
MTFSAFDFFLVTLFLFASFSFMYNTMNKQLKPNFKYVQIFSHNIQGNIKLLDNYIYQIEHTSDIYLLQDVGIRGSRILMDRRARKRDTILNISSTNRSRSTAILVGHNWNIVDQWINGDGSISAAIISNGSYFLSTASIYLPVGLDKIGLREGKQTKTSSLLQETRLEATRIYEELSQWILNTPMNIHWLVGGDLNETRSTLDRKEKSKAYTYNSHAKFINSFLRTNDGVDVWRRLHPRGPPGYTRFQQNPSRLDYFLIQKSWFSETSSKIDFLIGNDNSSDHMFISLKINIPFFHHAKIPWSVRRPKLPKTSIDKELLDNIYQKFKRCNTENLTTDYMLNFCRTIKISLGESYGWKGGNNYVRRIEECKVRRDLNIVKNIAAFARLVSEQPDSPFIDRYNTLILHSISHLEENGYIPLNLNLNSANVLDWLDSHLEILIARLNLKIARMGDIYQSLREREHELFISPNQRSNWFQSIGLGKLISSPPMILSNSLGQIISDPIDIKNTYVTKLSPILRSPIYLSFNECLSGPSEIIIPDLEHRTFHSSDISEWHVAPLVE